MSNFLILCSTCLTLRYIKKSSIFLHAASLNCIPKYQNGIITNIPALHTVLITAKSEVVCHIVGATQLTSEFCSVTGLRGLGFKLKFDLIG